MRDGGGLSSRKEYSVGSGAILKVEMTKTVGKLEVGCERKDLR